jgi:nucleotide-binding universal stress UspA family protein
MVRGVAPDAVRSILVVVDGSEASNNALGIACETAKRLHASLFGLHVIEVPRALPVDAELTADLERGEQVMSAAERAASKFDLKLEGNIVQARHAGTAVVDEAAALRVDAVVMGLAYHRSYGRYELGQTALTVLENALAQVWIIRYPPRPDQLA